MSEIDNKIDSLIVLAMVLFNELLWIFHQNYTKSPHMFNGRVYFYL